MFTPPQCRAARGFLDWSQHQLAEAAGVGVVTVRQFEGGASQPRPATLEVLRRALEAAGIEFTNGGQPGVRMRKPTVTETAATLTARIAGLQEALPIVDDQARPSPQKGMQQLERAHGKNEIAKAKGKRAKLAPKSEAPLAIPVDKLTAENDE